jgi:hypothetical protein
MCNVWRPLNKQACLRKLSCCLPVGIDNVTRFVMQCDCCVGSVHTYYIIIVRIAGFSTAKVDRGEVR